MKTGIKYTCCGIEGYLARLDWDIVLYSTPYYGYHFEPDFDKLPNHMIDIDKWFICRRDCPEDEIVNNLVEASRKDMGLRWKIEVEEHLHVKCKWEDEDLRRTCSLKIYRNDKLFYEEGCGTRQRGMRIAENLIEDWQCHVLDIGTIDFDTKMIGRKVWFRDEPAIVESFCWGSASVNLIPDKDAGCEKFSRPKRYQRDIDDGMYDYWPEYEYGLIVPLNSHDVDWFRD